MKSKCRLAMFICSLVLILDQITKQWVTQRMALHQSIEIVPNFLHLTYLRNTGAAFSFWAGTPSGWRTFFFILVSLVAIGCIGYLLKNLKPDRKTFTVSLSLILGGALGNLTDRLRLGEVIDFIDLHWYHIHWPIFNVADSAITIGIILLFFQMMRSRSWNF